MAGGWLPLSHRWFIIIERLRGEDSAKPPRGYAARGDYLGFTPPKLVSMAWTTEFLSFSLFSHSYASLFLATYYFSHSLFVLLSSWLPEWFERNNYQGRVNIHLIELITLTAGEYKDKGASE